MLVVKRDGSEQPIDFEKIHWRIKSMCATPEILKFQEKERPDAYSIFHKLKPINHADVDSITKKTIEGVYNKIPTTEIDKLSAEIAQEMCVIHPDNSTLATRILVSNLQKNIEEVLVKCFPDSDREDISKNLFFHVTRALYSNLNKHGERAPLVSPYIVGIARKYKDKIREIIDHSRDFSNHDYLGIKTLEKGYLFKLYSLGDQKNTILETPSIADMRTAIALVCAPKPCPEPYSDFLEFFKLHPEIIKEKYAKEYFQITNYKDKRIDSKLFKKLYWEYKYKEEIDVTDEQWKRIKKIYDGMSEGRFTPATPTRFSAGSLSPQGSSCFLIAMQDDSLKGIYDTLQETAHISKYAGGIGLWAHNIRSTGSYISGTNGISNGLKPMLKVFDASSRYVDQGGRRPGSMAVYLEPWHADILDFVKMKRKKGTDSEGTRSLFYALWIPDEFFRCWKDKKDWYLFDPSICPKLYDSYDEGFSETYLSDEYINENKNKFLFTYRYRKYIRQNKYEKKISPEMLMEEVVETVKESGVPYMTCKDATNRKSNQKNLGVIKSLNLCCEIAQYSDSTQTAVCNLSSICLNKFVRPFIEGDKFKYNVSLNDKEEWWSFDFEKFAKTVRICQNNIDSLIDLNFYPTEKARNSNMKTRPQASGLQGEADMLAILKLKWNGKEAQKLRFYIFERMYYECLKASLELAKINGKYEYFDGSPASKGKLQFDLWREEGKKISFQLSLPWNELREEIKIHGLRNSLFIGPMPTQSTSDIMGNSPSIEPFNSLVYVRKTNAGEITLINKNLVKDLVSIDLWNQKIRDKILTNHGSIQDILEIPKKLRYSYLTAYDLEPADIIDAAFVRGWFVDQSQSMNLFIKNVTMAELSKAWTRGWKRGLKTLSYYIRTRSAITSQKNQIKKEEKVEKETLVCSRDNPDCLSCGS
jgi:ribonucleoside-diphosphate reductase alpha chain